jgi:hypothetical protein
MAPAAALRTRPRRHRAHRQRGLPGSRPGELKERLDPDGLFPLAKILPGQHHRICNGNAFAGLIALIERIGGPACEAWVGSLKCKIAIADLDPESVEPVMTAVELSRQTRPLDLRRKIRNWEPIER